MTAGKPKVEADYFLKDKDPSTGKYRIVGAAWKKNGEYGPFISVSIGPPENRKSYLMVETKKGQAAGSLPPASRQEFPAVPEPDEEIPF